MPRSLLLVPWCAALLAGAAGAQVRLPDVRARGRTACEVHPETAEATADLWFLARSALEGAAATDTATPVLLVAEWRRSLWPNLRLRYERRDTVVRRTRSPFEKSLPFDLERAGYIRVRGNGVTYYGPGADHLLSEGFLRRHCFSRRTGSGAATGLVGLAFSPLPTQRLPDVEGVLWVDASERRLRYVEYTWINRPAEAMGTATGGRSDFVRLADGGWIVQRWNIRMPRPADYPGSEGYTDQGGEVLALGPRRPR
jgi:hypothetical protein